jgi:hypothetical protein
VEDKHLNAFLERFGAPTQPVPAPREVQEKYRGVLPSQLISYWQQLGFSGFKDGLFWVTDPSLYESALESWLGDTPILEEDAYYVIARSGFGDLYLWGTKTGHKFVIHAPRGWILKKDGDQAEIGSTGADSVIKRFFAIKTPAYADMDGADRRPLFERALQQHGPLKHDEVFAFEPSLIAGGEARLESIAKRNISVHLDLLSQFGRREVLDRQGLAGKAFGWQELEELCA